MEYSILILLAAFFALNMGGSNFGASFAAAYGGGIVSKRKAQVLFCIFVFLGAVLVGRPVANTLGSKIIPAQLVDVGLAIIIIISAAVSIWFANIIHVPQSTSLVTVAAIAGVGVYFGKVYSDTFAYLVSFWILLPVAGYVISYILGRFIYPLHKGNFWIYEKLVNHSGRLKAFVIFASCFNAFSVGTNNVANAVGPLIGAGFLTNIAGLVLLAPVFGLGSFVFQGSLKTAGEKIVPLGLLTATIVSLVTGSLMITASFLGIPQSFVMIKVACLFAIGGVKNGHKTTFLNPVTQKTYLTWSITPVIAFILSFLLTAARYKFFG